jgi:hypothetical protein
VVRLPTWPVPISIYTRRYSRRVRKLRRNQRVWTVNSEFSPYLRAKPSDRGGHKVSWFGFGVAGDTLCGFKGALIFQKNRDADRAE